MRPAQKAPENRSAPRGSRARGSGFNEAGAKSAGKQFELSLGFAEARALQ